MENEYMAQVMQQQAEVQDVLAKRAPKQRARQRQSVERAANAMPQAGAAPIPSGAELPAVDVRVTGWLRWKRVIVPPNAHVVHNRLGVAEPLHCGLGISFKFNPLTDSFLVVPAAMQTIMISANCICRERQGILVQGYVQWIVDDFSKAYRKLDFSDPVEPMSVVNLQLREQAEAAIKDTVASMSIDDVLADKQPIVKVLTTRLRELAEGDGQEAGLGLRIITVQIKEAVVSSTRLWESLQGPFRAERYKLARLAELTHEQEVQARESEANKERARTKIAADEEIAQHRGETEAAAFNREQSERVRRAQVEAQALAESLQDEKARLGALSQLEQLKVAQELEKMALREEAEFRRAGRELDLLSRRQQIENEVSPAHLQHRLVELLPEIAGQLPKPGELKSISLGGIEGLSPLIEGLTKLVGNRGGNGS